MQVSTKYKVISKEEMSHYLTLNIISLITPVLKPLPNVLYSLPMTLNSALSPFDPT